MEVVVMSKEYSGSVLKGSLLPFQFFIIALVSFLLLGFSPSLSMAAPYQQDAVTGHAIFEAEHADANISRSGYSWVDNFTAGYSGDSALRTSPTSGKGQKDPGYSQTSPQLDYQVNFTQTGTHYVWVRGYADLSSNNSVHVGLDGAEISSSEALGFPTNSVWTWVGGAGVASFEVLSPGVHTVNVWMRETGFRIDKLVVTSEAGFTPSGFGPTESPREVGGETPTAAAPTFTPTGGTFTDNVTISLDSATGAASTYYTTDGGTPDSGSTLYLGPFTLSSTTTVRAIAIADGFMDSPVSSESYTIVPSDSNQRPVAVAGGPYSGVVGAPISFDGSGSSDPDGDSLGYRWDFGDGSAPVTGINPVHSYAAAGTYTASLVVNDGTEDSLPSTVAVAVTASTPSGGSAYQQDAGTGHAVFEAEHADANISRSGYSWVANYTSGYSGDSAMRTSPVSGKAHKDAGYSQTSPQLDYRVNFVQTGTHYVWVRGYADRSNNNSVHVGLDGTEISSSEDLGFPTNSVWTWVGGAGVASFEVLSPGIHTVNVWMRETGFRIDKLVVTSDAGYQPTGFGPAESMRGTGTSLFEDHFNDGNVLGWTVINNCIKGSSDWSWVNGTFMQSGDCRGFSTEGVAIGSHALPGGSFPDGVDIQLRLRSEDPALDAVAANDDSIWKFAAIGLLFAYQDENNHYRFELDGMNGHRKLWRNQGGVFTELNTSPQSFVRGQWLNLRVIQKNGVILVFVDGQQIMAVADTAFSGGRLALFCARNASCSFDDIVVVEAPAGPLLGLNLPDSSVPAHASSEYFVDTDGVLDVSAVLVNEAGVGGVEFVVDEGTSYTLSQMDLAPPYRTQYLLTPGVHSISSYVLDGSADRLSEPDATVTIPQVGSGGIHLTGIGDSITAGLFDDLAGDDVSLNQFNTGGGYEPVLNDYLATSNGLPVTVLNDGNAGEESWEGAARIEAVLARTPEVQAYLVFYGANDSGGSLPTPSGLRLSSGDPGYEGSFKDHMQQLIDKIVKSPPQGAGKLVFLAKAPPYLANSARDAAVSEYNDVIDELVSDLKRDYPLKYSNYYPPDFYGYFTANPGEFASDGIHPKGSGYRSIARLWCEALNGQQGWVCDTSP
jgi:lysophospholipase L1-like esterase